ncbi:hypothetical protein OH491_13760 [Termitidicoccus mucosus]|uniref:Uncharacterized protein n=1 Tax=Termitidicoccus mucosus TaxID=1184151 RepID=A0A178IJF3_9BACT|nr:hypothetical protein AW736_13695 [Opitutaceae bacterium TSB47]
MNSIEAYLHDRENALRQREIPADLLAWFNHGLSPEDRLLKFDGWVRAELARRLDWSWAGAAKQKRIEQCRLHLERLVLGLWRRGWMLDGKRLAFHITTCLDAVGEYQLRGAVNDFWSYFKACVDRYVGANAEELRTEAMRVGSHVNQLLDAFGVTRRPSAPTMPELIAQRADEVTKAKTLREKQAAARRLQKQSNPDAPLLPGLGIPPATPRQRPHRAADSSQTFGKPGNSGMISSQT